MKTIELKDLLGKHKLSGVDITNEKIKEEYGDDYEDCQSISFELDGITYTAIEDPDDGYRSYLKEIGVTEIKVKNKFPEIEVVGVMKKNTEYEKNDTIEFYDTKNGKVVLSVGTDNTDDYYPYFVGEFVPENMSTNEGKRV